MNNILMDELKNDTREMRGGTWDKLKYNTYNIAKMVIHGFN